MRTFFVLALGVGYAAAHPHCINKATDSDQELTFCPAATDGACCNDLEEAVVEERFKGADTLTSECADYYKQVVCAQCGSYSGHLFERLGGELGTGDGLSMTNSFCAGLVDACSGQIEFPTYDGQDYCTKHTGGGEDLYWSYPYMKPEVFEPGFQKVFPDLFTGFEYTLALHQTPDGSMFWLGAKEGIIKKVDAASPTSSSTVLDISGGHFYDGSPEEGLLDFTFSPMFDTNGYFYVSFDIKDDVIMNRLSKFQYFSGDPEATHDSEEVLITSEERKEYLHNGGWLGFKPSVYGKEAAFHDLYWSLGDAGPQEDPFNHALRLDTLFGSIIRISVPSDGTGYEIPSGNYPGGMPEICAPGFRSHWRCGFDRDTDELYCGDVGFDKVESIYMVECGNNYGWVRFEGTRCSEYSQEIYGDCADADRSFMTPPIFEYCHFDYESTGDYEAVFTGGNDLCGDRSIVGNAVIGGFVYRGSAFADLDIYGAFVFADYEARNIYYIKKQSDGTWSHSTVISDGSVQVVSFAEDINGELMIIDTSNNIYALPCGDVCDNAVDDFGDGGPGVHSVNYVEVGCYTDAPDRVLTASSKIYDGTMTNEKCAGLCEGYAYFGTEYSLECFCGLSTDDPTILGAGTCDMPCAGESAETCGGNWAISVHMLDY